MDHEKPVRDSLLRMDQHQWAHLFNRCMEKMTTPPGIPEESVFLLLDQQGQAVARFQRKKYLSSYEREQEHRFSWSGIDQYGIGATGTIYQDDPELNCTRIAVPCKLDHGKNPVRYYVALFVPESGIDPNLTTGFMYGISNWIQNRFNMDDEQLLKEVTADIQRRDMLFHFTKKIHASIDVDDVLHTVMENIKQLYPDMHVELWLSHDFSQIKVAAKQLSVARDNRDISTKAFLTGRVMQGETVDRGNRQFTLAVPLRGRQGVYGVLQLNSSNRPELKDKDVEFITLLADSAGNAFENAQLYRQSQNLIHDLTMINEMARQMNTSLNLQDVYRFVVDKLTDTFHAEHACLLSREKGTDRFKIEATNHPEYAEMLIDGSTGIIRKLFSLREPVFIAEYDPNDGELYWPIPYQSMIAFPILGRNLEEVMMIHHSNPHRFSFDDYKLMEIIAQHAQMAITNAFLHTELEKMVITDNLTGLKVRSYLDEQIQISQESDQCGSLVLFDIDNFKDINDTHGHQTGDQILVNVSNIIKQNIRDTDTACRWGGEELAVYLPDVDKHLAAIIAERIRRRVKENTIPPVTVSAGVADWIREEKRKSLDQLFYEADMALYKAKNSGRDQIVIRNASSD